MWSYRVILLFSYLVPLQPDYCRLWFLSAVELNLTSSVLDEGLPKETHREGGNEPVIGNVHAFQDWHNLVTKGCLTKVMGCGVAGELWLALLWLERWASVWMKRADRALSAQLLPFPTACRAFWRKPNPFSYHVLSVTPRTIMLETGLSATTFT